MRAWVILGVLNVSLFFRCVRLISAGAVASVRGPLRELSDIFLFEQPGARDAGCS